jgi:hypothetical protein
VELAIIRPASLAALLTLSLLSGCKAYLEPYVPLNPLAAPDVPTSRIQNPPAAMVNVSHSMRELDAWEQIAAKKHDDLSTTIRWYNVATFGLAAGAVVAPIYNAYKDLTIGLALGAGGAYTANTLFFPTDQLGLYSSAQDAFMCISTRGQRLLSAISPDDSEATFKKTFNEFEASVCGCAKTPAYAALGDAYNAAFDSFARAIASDYGAGAQLQDAGRNVAIALNKEIDNRAASPAAIFAAAKSLASFSVPTSGTTTTARTPVAGFARYYGAPVCTLGCSNADLARIASETNAYIDRKKKLDGALDSIVQLDSACSFNPTPVPDMTISQDSVTLTKGAFVNVVVTGGRPPYTAIWEGTDPSGSGITADVSTPGVVRISQSTSSTAPAGTAATLDIQDSSVSGRKKTVAVTTK